MDPAQLDRARAAQGFMPEAEGLALHAAAAGLDVAGPLLEVGSYCGKSAIYLGTAARATGRVLYALDHHRGSEENQAGWEHHEPDLVDDRIGKMDTFPIFRRTVHDAGLEGTVVALVGDSPTIAANWETPLAMLFIDGGHGEEPARLDRLNWLPKLKRGGMLAIHDVFLDPAEGGRAPYEQIYLPVMASGAFTEVLVQGSLRVLRRDRS